MALILFDTNIFIDMLGGCHQASIELNSYDEPAISAITYMELSAGVMAYPHEKARLDAVLKMFAVLPIDWEITDQAIAIRGSSLLTPPKIKLPDAIIGATAVRWGLPLVTQSERFCRPLNPNSRALRLRLQNRRRVERAVALWQPVDASFRTS